MGSVGSLSDLMGLWGSGGNLSDHGGIGRISGGYLYRIVGAVHSDHGGSVGSAGYLCRINRLFFRISVVGGYRWG